MLAKRCFLQWFMLVLSYTVAAFFCVTAGLAQAVWDADVTHITSVIAIVFVASCGYLGLTSWRHDNIDNTQLGSALKVAEVSADTNFGRTMAFIVTLLGLLGTAIGLMFQAKAMGQLDVSNPQNIVGFIGTIGSALSTALYATASGIIACIGITLMNLNIEYFIDRQAVNK